MSYFHRTNTTNTSLNTFSNSESHNESESEEDEKFSPEMFDLLDNPGVVRFEYVDYPLTVSEHSGEEYAVEHKAEKDWIRVSCDDLTKENNVVRDRVQISDKRKLSRSVNDIINQMDDAM